MQWVQYAGLPLRSARKSPLSLGALAIIPATPRHRRHHAVCTLTRHRHRHVGFTKAALLAPWRLDKRSHHVATPSLQLYPFPW